MNPLYTTLISALVSAAISWLVSITLKEREYKNEYYKKIIDKRFALYESLSTLITLISVQINGKGVDRPYNIVFSSIEKYNEAKVMQLSILRQGVWLDSRTRNQLRELNECFRLVEESYNISDITDLIKAGKHYNQFLSDVRHSLETQLRRDLKTLYDVSEFLTWGKRV